MVEPLWIAMERNLIINNRQIHYSGIFSVEDLFHVINQAIEDKGYEKKEKRSEEIVNESGKNFYLELRPYKECTNYIFLMIKIKIELNNLTETVQEFDGVKKMFQDGDIQITFDSWLLTDYKDRWGMKPFVYFMKGMFNKLVFRQKLEPSFTGVLMGDTAHIYGSIKRLLAKYRKQDDTYAFEHDVRKDVKKEIEEKYGASEERAGKSEVDVGF